MKPLSLKLALSLLFASYPISQADATQPPLRCADLAVAAERAGEDMAEQTGRGIVRVDGTRIASPEALQAAVNRDGVEAAIIVGGQFHGWDFSGLSLRLACFVDSDLSGTNWFKAQLSAPAFVRTNLQGANFRAADLPHAYLHNSNLKDVDTRGANLASGRFGGGWFEGSVEGWNLDGADMTGFLFECGITVPDGCPVYQDGDGISARGADFTGATLYSFGLHDADLAGAIVDRTIIGPGQLPALAEAEFRGPVILRGGDRDVRISGGDAQELLAENARQAASETAASFDCAQAASKVEQAICGAHASDLRRADREMAALYRRAKTVDVDVRACQLAWLTQRNRCAAADFPSDCIREHYAIRKGQLLGLLGETDWLGKGEAALFVDDVLPLPAAFRQSALFENITPVLVAASMTEILVERGENGLYTIRGSAVGANAHLCSLSASHLYFDRDSGWYIPVSEGPAIPIFRIFDGRLEIFADGRPDHEQYPEASDFMSCGMRASFGETVRIDAGEALIDRYRQSLSEGM